jgi:hypothetical protein
MRGPHGEYFVGYSGFAMYKNDPNAEAVHDMGPIPRGHWRIDLHPYAGQHIGPYTLRLTPIGHNAAGRNANTFRIHGENHHHPGASSGGCIILSPQARHAIVHSGDDSLTVERD